MSKPNRLPINTRGIPDNHTRLKALHATHYDPHAIARFVANYRHVARGLVDAVNAYARASVTWLCPYCETLRRNRGLRPFDYTCGGCGWQGDHDQLCTADTSKLRAELALREKYGND